MQRLGRIRSCALTTAETSRSSRVPPSSVGHWHLADQTCVRFDTGCRGFNGPVPQPLWMMGKMLDAPARSRHSTIVTPRLSRAPAARAGATRAGIARAGATRAGIAKA